MRERIPVSWDEVREVTPEYGGIARLTDGSEVPMSRIAIAGQVEPTTELDEPNGII